MQDSRALQRAPVAEIERSRVDVAKIRYAPLQERILNRPLLRVACIGASPVPSPPLSNFMRVTLGGTRYERAHKN